MQQDKKIAKSGGRPHGHRPHRRRANPPELSAQIEEGAHQRADTFEPEAIRRLVELGLKVKK